MRVEVIPGDRLDAALAARWRALRRAAAAGGGAGGLDSPYLDPGFTAAAARPGVAVGVVHENGTPVAFLPFQRDEAGDGEPVAGGASDAQALIAEPGFDCDARELVRACGLPRWRFSHLAADQAPFRPFHHQAHELVSIDLAAGFDAWAGRRRGAGSKLLKDLGRRRRNLEREAGPVRFEAVCRDPAALARLFEWKSRQYRASGLRDWLAESWLRELLERALASDDPDFGATLSALWVGDALAAAQVALRSRSVWHWWYPAYDPRFARWSPGLLLDLEMIAAAGSLGLVRIDLGRASPHKARLTDAARPAASGEVPAADA